MKLPSPKLGLAVFVVYLHHMAFLDPPWIWQFFITLGVEYTVLEFLGRCSNVEICLPTKWPDEGSMVNTGVFLMNRPEQWPKPCFFFCIYGITLPSYTRIIISHDEDPYNPISIMECHKGFECFSPDEFWWYCWWTNILLKSCGGP